MLFEPARALRYSVDVEHEEAGEEKVAEELCKTMHGINEKTFKDGGHAIRSVHAKSHALLEGELEIDGDLHPTLAQGLFAQPGRYPVVIRISTIPGDILDDSVSSPRGMAIKVIGVQGERVAGTEGDVTQDFVLVNGPGFSAPNTKVFLGNLKLLAATTDRIEGVKKVASAFLRGVEAVVESVGVESATLKTLGGQPETHILGDSFYSQVPLRWGDHIAKVGVFPTSPELKALTDAPLNVNGKPDGLREAVNAFFGEHGGTWDIRAQLCVDLNDTPVENAHKVWDEDKSPYLSIGRITVKPQTGWSEARSKVVDDGLSFTPWHALAAHRPLGSIMRARKRAYEMSARFRAEHNGVRVAEPREAVRLP